MTETSCSRRSMKSMIFPRCDALPQQAAQLNQLSCKFSSKHLVTVSRSRVPAALLPLNPSFSFPSVKNVFLLPTVLSCYFRGVWRPKEIGPNWCRCVRREHGLIHFHFRSGSIWLLCDTCFVNSALRNALSSWWPSPVFFDTCPYISLGYCNFVLESSRSQNLPLRFYAELSWSAAMVHGLVKTTK